MGKDNKKEKNNIPEAPQVVKKRFFNVEKRFGYTMHEMWRYKVSYIMMAPYFIAFLVFSLIPLIVSTWWSLCYFNGIEAAKFIGWDNFLYLFLEDSLFLKAFSNTITFAILVGPATYIMSYFFAWFINQVPQKYRPYYVLALYAPSLSVSVLGLFWLVFFANDSQGYLNSILMSMGIIYEPIQWTTDVNYIMPVIVFVSLWTGLGTGFLSFVAGFTNVDTELYDAASVDGVTSKFQRLIYVDIPQTMPQLLFAAILQITGMFTVGGICAAIAGNPSPEDTALTITLHLADYSGNRLEVGYASAIAVLLSVMIIGCGRMAFKLLGEKEG